MTATERLRQLLDERGVEWRRTPHYSSESMDNETVFCGIGIEWLASDHLNGRLGLRALKYEVTPEQAVEATLGRGTCRKVRAWEDDPRGGGGWVLVCSECDELLANDGEDGEFDGPNYCPNCGRRVEKWRKESSA